MDSMDGLRSINPVMSDVSSALFAKRQRLVCNNFEYRRSRWSTLQNSVNMILLAILALFTRGSTALTCSSIQSTLRHRDLSTYPCYAVLRSGQCNSITPSRRMLHLCATKNIQKSYDEYEDDDQESCEDDQDIDDKLFDKDDLDSDEYLEHLISNAMEEDVRTRQAETTVQPAAYDSIDSNSSSNTDSTLKETKRMMQQQQQQIDLLMKMIQSQQQPSAPGKTSFAMSTTQNASEKSVNVTPLKIMFFIDGTWLYYSMHARREDKCTVTRKFGKGWQAKYKVDWMALPRLICNEIEKQRGGQKSFKGSDRPLDIARVSVFTSAKKETDPNSIRMRMFRDMANANYDVHMMETIGKGEKCVDIQLAVEMLHYATVPNAFDLAVILTGDKDFVPALVRTRQKGKEVVICSMKSGCNRVLSESPHIRDYNVVWLEHVLDELIVPISETERDRLNRADYTSAFTMCRVIRDYVQAAPNDMNFVSSRDIGRYLKSVKIADSTMLDELKQSHGGLWNFLNGRAKDLFEVQTPVNMRQATDHSFGVKVKDGSDDVLVEEFKRTQYFSHEEKQFLKKYRKPYDALYSHTEYLSDEDDPDSLDDIKPMPDYSKMTVATLKEICREKNLPVSGKKDDLKERLEECYQEYEKLARIASQKRRLEWKEAPRKAIARINAPSNVYSSTLPQLDLTQTTKTIDSRTAAHLEELVKEYLTARGGVASSRDIGRYLAANSDSGKGNQSALAELKESYGSLLSFLHSRSLFDVDNSIPDVQAKALGFPVKLTTVKR